VPLTSVGESVPTKRRPKKMAVNTRMEKLRGNSHRSRRLPGVSNTDWAGGKIDLTGFVERVGLIELKKSRPFSLNMLSEASVLFESSLSVDGDGSGVASKPV